MRDGVVAKLSDEALTHLDSQYTKGLSKQDARTLALLLKTTERHCRHVVLEGVYPASARDKEHVVHVVLSTLRVCWDHLIVPWIGSVDPSMYPVVPTRDGSNRCVITYPFSEYVCVTLRKAILEPPDSASNLIHRAGAHAAFEINRRLASALYDLPGRPEHTHKRDELYHLGALLAEASPSYTPYVFAGHALWTALAGRAPADGECATKIYHQDRPIVLALALNSHQDELVVGSVREGSAVWYPYLPIAFGVGVGGVSERSTFANYTPTYRIQLVD